QGRAPPPRPASPRARRSPPTDQDSGSEPASAGRGRRGCPLVSVRPGRNFRDVRNLPEVRESCALVAPGVAPGTRRPDRGEIPAAPLTVVAPELRSPPASCGVASARGAQPATRVIACAPRSTLGPSRAADDD